MKNYLTLFLAVAVVSSPAYASRARLEALGEGKNGSYYIDDSRNMFLNPASIVKYKKKMMLELGSGDVATTFVDNAAASRAQGGFTNTFGDFTYALYLNNTSDTALGLMVLNGFTAALPSNALEFQLAGEGTANWGLGVTTAGNRQGLNSSSYWAARFGVEKDAAALFGTVGISSSSKKANGDEFKGKLNLNLGATYKMDSMTVFAKYGSTSFDVTPNAGTATNTAISNFGVGAGWKKEMTKSTNMFARVEADSQTKKVADVETTKEYNIPLTLGAESQVLSWLAVRGSVGQSLLGATGFNSNSRAGSTTVAAGIGMTFGDVNIDGLVASNGNTSADALGMGTQSAANQSFGFGDKMISRIGLTYNF